jgi:hypothetical protein
MVSNNAEQSPEPKQEAEQVVGGQPPFSPSISKSSLSNSGGATTLTLGENYEANRNTRSGSVAAFGFSSSMSI